MKLDKLPQSAKSGHLIVKRIEGDEEDKKVGNIIMPDSLTSIFARAEVVLVGNDLADYKMDCSAGDKVLVNKNMIAKTLQTFTVDDVQYFILREESDVFAKL